LEEVVVLFYIGKEQVWWML